MDFVDSFNLDSARAKCKRVRSWYLYEQYRSLEKNQLDAAQRLKDKSYQDKILRQELSERRARRRLCDQFGLCQSESRLDRSVRSIPSNVLLGDDELFESFCELRDEYELENYEDNNSHDSQTSKEFEDFKSTDTRISFGADAKNVVENLKVEKLDEDIKEELESVKKNIAENISLQLETVKENIECLEKYTKLEEDEEIPDVDVTLISPLKSNVDTFNNEFKKDRENSVIKMWSKFVDFAYKIILLNRGNCYYNYSSQLLTAVLACDVLLRGVSRMCT
ncbi:unnamed protein product [Euphydryas editha]|uniref:Uncharacterized protein n=1 Tax=Euphydryas editha TaxID=104508 RepID=A0AAU9V595_EUPED|nr:unnamed protein product [Euphydryas editha]